MDFLRQVSAGSTHQLSSNFFSKTYSATNLRVTKPGMVTQYSRSLPNHQIIAHHHSLLSMTNQINIHQQVEGLSQMGVSKSL